MSPRPLLAVDDVPAASRWFQEVLGLVSAHGGDEYEMLVDGDRLVLQLHHWDAHEHPHLGRADTVRGNGVLVWFAVDDLDAVADRARAARAEILDGPVFNPAARHRELWLRHPDGYVVVASGD
ncbi:MAG: VOC family protein [Actinomyces sp.]|nr:MAG: VOC family protein [Actinomyces sp.]